MELFLPPDCRILNVKIADTFHLMQIYLMQAVSLRW